LASRKLTELQPRTLLPTRPLTVGDATVRYHTSGNGPSLLLLHGFPETLQAWAGLAPVMARDFTVHAFDWPGLGLSETPGDFDFSYTGYARFLEDLMDVAHVRDAVIVATDIGVPPALLLALRKPGRVRSLVVCDGPVFERPHLFTWPARSLRTAPLAEILLWGLPRSMLYLSMQWGFYGEPAITPDQYEDFHAAVRRDSMRTAALELFRREASFHAEFDHGVHSLRTPLSILWGEDDGFVRPEMGMLLKAACPHASLQIVPRCGHFLHQEKPQVVLDAIASTA
jgi:pimeloyl-ACP methyl ester carboxylesterase